jgi:hypothetical protein
MEARSIGAMAEDLAVDAVYSGQFVQGVAMNLESLSQIRSEVSRPLELVSTVPAVLRKVFGPDSILCWGGEQIEITREGWRAFPIEGPDEPGTLMWNGTEIKAGIAAAFAAALVDPEEVPNLVRSSPAASRLRRYRDVLLNLGAAAALLLGALGLHFHRDAVANRQAMEVVRRAERELWSRFLPSEEPKPARLLQAMRERLFESGEALQASEVPSALAFWGEIGKQMPDPELLGLTLESLDLGPDGGRLSARVPARKEDPLKNAAELEGKLNQSKRVTARGDYEVQGGQVLVRLRMDYKP